MVPKDWRKTNVTRIFINGKKENSGNYRLVSLTSGPAKVTRQMSLETISTHMKDKKVISSQHVFTKMKSCLINLITFFN